MSGGGPRASSRLNLSRPAPHMGRTATPGVRRMGAVTQSLITVELGNGGWARQVLDVLEHDGAAWLVTGWVLAPDGRTRRPVRLVSLAMADTGEPTADRSDFAGFPIPESILSEGRVPLAHARLFVIREAPEFWVPSEGQAG